MKLIDHEQGSDAWLDWRSNGVGASEVAALFNGRPFNIECVPEHNQDDAFTVEVSGTPYGTAYQLWAMKTGVMDPPDLSNNPAVKRGNRLEGEARNAANAFYGEMGLPATAEHDELPYLRASFDAVMSNGDTLEIKAPGKSVWSKIVAYGPPGYYVPQIAQQMVVRGADVGRFFAYQGDGSYLAYRFDRVGQMAELCDAIEPAVTAFWRCVENGTAPDKDPDKDVLEFDDPDWDAKAEAWLQAKAEEARLKADYEAAQADRKKLEAPLVDQLGGFASGVGAGVRVTRFTRKGSIDYQKALAAYQPDLDEDTLESYRKKGSNGVSVTDTRPKADSDA